MREMILHQNLTSVCTGERYSHRLLVTAITKLTCHPYKVRRLSVAEILAIQSLPIKFALPAKMTLTNMFKTVGNGVHLSGSATGIAATILQFLDNGSQ